MPKLDAEKCDCCGLCVSACECGAVVMTKHRIIIIETEECSWCTMCELVCPNNAITCAYDIVFDNRT